MRSTTTASFRKCFRELPPRIQTRAREAYRTFAEDPTHPALQFKQAHTSRPIYSARVSIVSEPPCRIAEGAGRTTSVQLTPSQELRRRPKDVAC